MKIKDLIIERLNRYTTVLKRELVIAKNIIKNPILIKKFKSNMNFSLIDIYKFNQGTEDTVQSVAESKSFD